MNDQRRKRRVLQGPARTWRKIGDPDGTVRKVEVRRAGGPISSHTAKTILQHVRQFFAWSDLHDEATGFTEPKKFAAIWKYAPKARKWIPPKMDELKKLYAVATDWQRCLLLLGATCGQTQTELAYTTAEEFDLKSAIWTHLRHKTRVEGSHWLCPELVKLLRPILAKREGDELAFRTREGNPMVTATSDAVRQTWDDLQGKAGLMRRVSFAKLRKYLATYLTSVGGEELGQMGLQHKPQSVLRKHYATQIANFNPLHQAQKQLHEAMTAGGVFGLG